MHLRPNDLSDGDLRRNGVLTAQPASNESRDTFILARIRSQVTTEERLLNAFQRVPKSPPEIQSTLLLGLALQIYRVSPDGGQDMGGNESVDHANLTNSLMTASARLPTSMRSNDLNRVLDIAERTAFLANVTPVSIVLERGDFNATAAFYGLTQTELRNEVSVQLTGQNASPAEVSDRLVFLESLPSYSQPFPSHPAA